MPNASMSSTPPSFARSRSFTSSENSAPADDITISDDVSYAAPAACSASAIGRAIASPTMEMMFTLSRSTSDQISCASSRRDVASTTLPPLCRPIIAAQCPLPCISGATGSVAGGAVRAIAFVPISSGAVIGGPPGLPPCSPAKKTSSCRHMTPFGMPVVPPV
jgi:hypothetical protein